jgi:5-methylcytosine-specific restriction endonuclease McrA
MIMDAPVLVLNANFEPINVCNFQRAIGLMLTEKATLILNGRGVIHTTNNTYPIPSVIRLSHMVHRPRIKVALSKREIFRRDHYTCQYCGRPSVNLTVDHVIPKHLGGLHEWENLVTACYACNHLKGGRTLADSGMTLLRQPKEPPASASYIFARFLPNNNEWVGFLEGW